MANVTFVDETQIIFQPLYGLVKTGEIRYTCFIREHVRYIDDTLNYEGNIMADNLLSVALNILMLIYAVK